MSKLATRAEVSKLADALGLAPASLDFLAAYDAEPIRDLRESVYDVLIRDDEKLFRRMAGLIGWLPTWLIAWLAGRVFGPLLAARVGVNLPPRTGAAVLNRLEPGFAATTATESDPRRIRDLMAQASTEVVVRLVRVLCRRGQYMVIGRFADTVPDSVIDTVLETSSDEELLQILYFMDSRNRLDHYVRMLPEARLRRMMLLAQDEEKNLGVQVLALLVHVSHRLKPKLADMLAEQSEELLVAMARSVQREGLWPDWLPVAAAMSPVNQRKIVNLPISKDPAVLEAIGRAADEGLLWSLVLPMIGLMNEPTRAAVALDMARRPEALRPAVEAALIGECWEPLLDVVRRMPPDRQLGFAAIVRELGAVDRSLLARLARRAEDHGFVVGLLAAA